MRKNTCLRAANIAEPDQRTRVVQSTACSLKKRQAQVRILRQASSKRGSGKRSDYSWPMRTALALVELRKHCGFGDHFSKVGIMQCNVAA